MPRLVLATFAVLALSSFSLSGQIIPAAAPPRVELRRTIPLKLPGAIDSNSPAVWGLVNGQRRLFVMTSWGGRPSIASGSSLNKLGEAAPIAMEPWPNGGAWMEAVVPDVDGTWYGYYHLETQGTVCADDSRVIPSIGAARSRDFGATWESLGTVLAAPTSSAGCVTNDAYNLGGVGDFSVMLDAQSQDLFFFYTQYVHNARLQGVGIARLAWADRDRPSRRVMVWQDGRWISATSRRAEDRWVQLAFPIFPVVESWHDEDTIVDAFWGPSVHWNTYLQQYVMLLNRSKDNHWTQEGIYVSFNKQLGDPRTWSTPAKIMSGGSWYPQVMGLEDGTGTDKVAGENARLFVHGASSFLIRFIR